jgi:protein SCO1
VARGPAISQPQDEADRVLDGGFWLVVGMAAVCGVLVLAMIARGVLAPGPGAGGTSPGTAAQSGASGTAPAPIDVAAFLYPTPREAPSIELTDPDVRPFSLASLRGEPAFVFFGYTHCPDVCPATIGRVGLAMDAFGSGVHAVFVSVDPERDTTTWLKEYVRFLPAGFVALTGTDGAIRTTADAWNVRYARVETGVPGAYSMSHSADVYLVDADGILRAHFPFGTESDAMTAVLREVVATTAAVAPPAGTAVTPAPATPGPPVASAGPTTSVDVEVVSTSVWAGNPGPVILTLSTGGAPLNDPALHPTVQLERPTGEAVGDAVAATPVQPPGVDTVSYVANLAIPTPGAWRLQVVATRTGETLAGSAALTALDPGTTAPLGAPAPGARTPTLDDVGGNARAVTTDPAPDLRLSRRSTTDALAQGQPFVLVIDSAKFRVSPACGRAIIMARYLLDRWPTVGFIHLEPYRYSVVTDTPVLDGSLDSPTLTDVTAAWGVGGDPWGARSMPWVFVVDGHGIVRAKYQGVMGSADVDVIVALIEAGG